MIVAIGKKVIKITNLYKHNGKFWAAINHDFKIPEDLGFKINEKLVYSRIWNGKKYIDCSQREIVRT